MGRTRVAGTGKARTAVAEKRSPPAANIGGPLAQELSAQARCDLRDCSYGGGLVQGNMSESCDSGGRGVTIGLVVVYDGWGG